MLNTKTAGAWIAGAVLALLTSIVASAQMMAGKPVPAMAAVLTELAVLGGKPIAMLTPQEARLQPSAADAFARVAARAGKSGSMPVGDVADTMFHANGSDIPLRIYTPPGTGPFPVLVRCRAPSARRRCEDDRRFGRIPLSTRTQVSGGDERRVCGRLMDDEERVHVRW